MMKVMGISKAQVHIGKFGVDECKRLIDRLSRPGCRIARRMLFWVSGRTAKGKTCSAARFLWKSEPLLSIERRNAMAFYLCEKIPDERQKYRMIGHIGLLGHGRALQTLWRKKNMPVGKGWHISQHELCSEVLLQWKKYLSSQLQTPVRIFSPESISVIINYGHQTDGSRIGNRVVSEISDMYAFTYNDGTDVMVKVTKRYSGWLPDAENKAGEPYLGEFYPYDDSKENDGRGFFQLDPRWLYNKQKPIFVYGEMVNYFRQLI
jgi:hypothetical protein